jgi:hypothetical protein
MMGTNRWRGNPCRQLGQLGFWDDSHPDLYPNHQLYHQLYHDNDNNHIKILICHNHNHNHNQNHALSYHNHQFIVRPRLPRFGFSEIHPGLVAEIPQVHWAEVVPGSKWVTLWIMRTRYFGVKIVQQNLTGAKRREWMGCGGLLRWLLVIMDHSLIPC